MIGVCTDDGECVGGPELRLLRRNQEQVQVKSEGRRAKTECQNPTVEGWKNGKRTVREPVSRRISLLGGIGG